MRIDPCKQCGASDRYVKGNFSYCRPCHTEAQKRYALNKKTGTTPFRETQYKPQPLSKMLEKNPKPLKSRCAKGHLLAGDNLRLELGAKVVRRCKACERNAKRITYGLRPEASPSKLSELINAQLDSSADSV